MPTSGIFKRHTEAFYANKNKYGLRHSFTVKNAKHTTGVKKGHGCVGTHGKLMTACGSNSTHCLKTIPVMMPALLCCFEW